MICKYKAVLLQIAVLFSSKTRFMAMIKVTFQSLYNTISIRKTPRHRWRLMHTTALTKLISRALLCASLAFSTSSQAAEKLFELLLNTQVHGGVGKHVAQVAFSSVKGNELKIGDVFGVALPSGTVVPGKVILNSGTMPIQGHGEEFVSASTDSKVITLRDAGALEVHLVGDTIAGITLNDTVSGKIYRARLNENGTGHLAEIDPDSVLAR